MIDWVKAVRAIEKPKGNPWKKDGQKLQLIPTCQTQAKPVQSECPHYFAIPNLLKFSEIICSHLYQLQLPL